MHFWIHSRTSMSAQLQKYQTRGQYWKLLRTNVLPKSSLTSGSSHFDCLCKAISLRAASFVIFFTWWWKVTLSSMTIARRSTVHDGSMTISPREIQNPGSGVLLCRLHWNLSGFSLMWFSSNHLSANTAFISYTHLVLHFDCCHRHNLQVIPPQKTSRSNL